MNSIRILEGDSLSVLRTLPDDSVQVCVTSPPYWGLRDYGTAKWEGGDPSCEHKGKSKPRQDTTGSGVGHGRFSDSRGLQPGKAAYVVPVRGSCVCGAIRVDAQIGLEKTPEEYIAKLVTVFDEVRRVLRKDGTLWLNIGDCYATGAGAVGDQPGGGKQGARWRGDVDRVRDTKRAYRKGSNRAQRGDGNSGQPFGPMTQPNRMPIQGLKPKDLVGVPWMLAFALRAAGWWLRSDIIWHKPNPMPESTKDRPTKAHEYIFLLTKSQRYYYDAAAITEASSENTNPRRAGNQKWPAGWGQGEESRNSVTHPYLASPENAAAFAYLAANPSGSRARWAKGLGWSPSKVQRFIEALLRFRLAETEVLKGYNLTVFKPLVDPPVSDRSATGPRADRARSAAGQPHLEASRSGSSVSRCKSAPANGGNAEAMTCIAVVNEVLGSNFGDNYTPISPDNYGSHRAVLQWIAAGMSLEDMTRLLRRRPRRSILRSRAAISRDRSATSPGGCSKSGRSRSASCRCRS
jgi:hypothetical protein